MEGSTAIRGKPARVMTVKLSDKLRDCYSASVPDATPDDDAFTAYDAWFRAEVEAAMASDGPVIPHDQVMAELGTDPPSLGQRCYISVQSLLRCSPGGGGRLGHHRTRKAARRAARSARIAVKCSGSALIRARHAAPAGR